MPPRGQRLRTRLGHTFGCNAVGRQLARADGTVRVLFVAAELTEPGRGQGERPAADAAKATIELVGLDEWIKRWRDTA